MVTVSINGMSVPADNASQGWINQMLVEANKRGAPPCIQVSVHVEGAQLNLATPGCGSSGGGGRPPNERERRIIDAWRKRGFGEGRINPGDLRAFLQDLARLT